MSLPSVRRTFFAHTWGKLFPDGQEHFEPFSANFLPAAALQQSPPSIRQVCFGRSHLLIATDDGSLYAFGDGRQGQLGLGPMTTTGSVAEQIPRASFGGQGVACCYARHDSSIAVTEDGRVYVWGTGCNEFIGGDAPQTINQPTQLASTGQFPPPHASLSDSRSPLPSSSVTPQNQIISVSDSFGCLVGRADNRGHRTSLMVWGSSEFGRFLNSNEVAQQAGRQQNGSRVKMNKQIAASPSSGTISSPATAPRKGSGGLFACLRPAASAETGSSSSNGNAGSGSAGASSSSSSPSGSGSSSSGGGSKIASKGSKIHGSKRAGSSDVDPDRSRLGVWELWRVDIESAVVNQTCVTVLTSAGDVLVCGDVSENREDAATPLHRSLAPLLVAPERGFHILSCPTKVQHVSVGSSWVAAIAEGQLYTCGQNPHGVLGLGHSEPVDELTRVANLSEVAGVSAGAAHMVAISRSGTVWSWGGGSCGQLVRPLLNHANDELLPQRVVLPGVRPVSVFVGPTSTTLVFHHLRFGTSLETALAEDPSPEAAQHLVPHLARMCLDFLEEHAVAHASRSTQLIHFERLRSAEIMNAVTELEVALEAGEVDFERLIDSPEVVIGVLLTYLTKLSQPVLSSNVCREIADVPAPTLPLALHAYASWVHEHAEIPETNREIFKRLLRLLQIFRAADPSLSAETLAQAFGPALFHLSGNDSLHQILTNMIEHAHMILSPFVFALLKHLRLYVPKEDLASAWPVQPFLESHIAHLPSELQENVVHQLLLFSGILDIEFIITEPPEQELVEEEQPESAATRTERSCSVDSETARKAKRLSRSVSGYRLRRSSVMSSSDSGNLISRSMSMTTQEAASDIPQQYQTTALLPGAVTFTLSKSQGALDALNPDHNKINNGATGTAISGEGSPSKLSLSSPAASPSSHAITKVVLPPLPLQHSELTLSGPASARDGAASSSAAAAAVGGPIDVIQNAAHVHATEVIYFKIEEFWANPLSFDTQEQAQASLGLVSSLVSLSILNAQQLLATEIFSQCLLQIETALNASSSSSSSSNSSASKSKTSAASSSSPRWVNEMLEWFEGLGAPERLLCDIKSEELHGRMAVQNLHETVHQLVQDLAVNHEPLSQHVGKLKSAEQERGDACKKTFADVHRIVTSGNSESLSEMKSTTLMRLGELSQKCEFLLKSLRELSADSALAQADIDNFTSDCHLAFASLARMVFSLVACGSTSEFLFELKTVMASIGYGSTEYQDEEKKMSENLGQYQPKRRLRKSQRRSRRNNRRLSTKEPLLQPKSL